MYFFTFRLTPDQLNTIFAGLAELPLKQSADLFNGLQQEVQRQSGAAAANAIPQTNPLPATPSGYVDAAPPPDEPDPNVA